jgi:hypothetical protein
MRPVTRRGVHRRPEAHDRGLGPLSAALANGGAGGVRITTRQGELGISAPQLQKLDKATGQAALEEEVAGAGRPASAGCAEERRLPDRLLRVEGRADGDDAVIGGRLGR